MQRYYDKGRKTRDTDPPDLTGKARMPSKEAIREALNDEAKFHQLIDCFKTFHVCLQIYKEDMALCESMTHFITTHPNEFKHIIESSSNVAFIAEYVSPKLGEEVIEHILADDNEFDRIVKSRFDLQRLNKAFPNHATIFSKDNVDAAKEEMHKLRK